MKRYTKYLFGLLILFFNINVFAQSNQEKITNFYTEIKINQNGSLDIREEITVETNQNLFKHGIYRDFFTKKLNGNLRNQKYIVKSAQINNLDTKYSEEYEDGNLRIYIGDPQIVLRPGSYKFSLNYTALNSESYFDENNEEIFWNLNGELPVQIDKLWGKIFLPKNISTDDIKVTGFIGLFGTKNKFTNYQVENGVINFRTDRVLNQNENVSLAISFPKNFFTGNTEFRENVKNILFSSILLINIIPLLIFFLIFKNNGADSKILNASVNYDIPSDISPSIFRYLYKNIVDFKSLSCELINLAVEKSIKIERIENSGLFGFGKKDDFIFTKILNESNNSTLKSYLMSKLFANNIDKINSYETKFEDNFGKAFSKLREEVYSSDYSYSILQNFDLSGKKKYVPRQVYAFLMGIFIFFTGIFSHSNGLREDSTIFFISSIIIIINSFIYKSVIKNYKLNRDFKSLFLLIFYLASISIIFTLLVPGGNIKYLVLTSLLPFIIIEFYNSFDEHSEKGIETLALIIGFKKFAETQKNYLADVKEDFPLSLNMYEKYLPYALALDIETQWSQKFAEAIKILEEQKLNSTDYVYFHSNSFNSSITRSTSSYFNSKGLSRSSSSGSSSSGFSGGGSSGGGGGSRGGGGW